MRVINSNKVLRLLVPVLTPDEIKASLETLAKLHRVSVPELLASAKAAGPGGPEYLVRAANLSRRLERLEANQ